MRLLRRCEKGNLLAVEINKWPSRREYGHSPQRHFDGHSGIIGNILPIDMSLWMLLITTMFAARLASSTPIDAVTMAP